MGGNMQQPEKKQIKGDRGGGTAARDVSVLITQQRLALNLHRSGGSYEKRIIWYGNDTVFTLIGTDSRVGGMRQRHSSWIILRESPPSPAPEWPMLYSCSCREAEVASVCAEFICGGWCECATLKKSKKNLSPSNTLLCSFVWVCKQTVV